MNNLLSRISRKFSKIRGRKLRISKNMKHIIGIVLGVVGAIIIIQVVPMSIWFFLLGILLLALAWALFNML
ncbi:hypothetical protein PV797_08165 [Clostridiaceae bacterium M8S5]|nr:hypothetical protein PV797_08165 [Clostridiaceae bacterium M8S5]